MKLTNTLHAAPNLRTDTQELAEVPARNLDHTVVQAGLKGCCSPGNRVPERQGARKIEKNIQGEPPVPLIGLFCDYFQLPTPLTPGFPRSYT